MATTDVTPGGLTATSPGQSDRVRAALENAEAKVTAIDEPAADEDEAPVTAELAADTELASDPHPYQVMPPLDPEDFAALRRSIEKEGMLLPVIVDGAGNIIDGHHRAAIAHELGFEYPVVVRKGLTAAQKRSLAYTLNIARRQLTREQLRYLIAKSLKADPQLSDREHGRRGGVDHKTVAKVRDEMEGRGDIPHVSTRTDSAGRKQPAPRPPAALEPEPAPEPTGSDTPDTTPDEPAGIVVDARKLASGLGKDTVKLAELLDRGDYEENQVAVDTTLQMAIEDFAELWGSRLPQPCVEPVEAAEPAGDEPLMRAWNLFYPHDGAAHLNAILYNHDLLRIPLGGKKLAPQITPNVAADLANHLHLQLPRINELIDRLERRARGRA